MAIPAGKTIQKLNMEIFTIGHSNIPLSEFLSLLEKHKIESVVDVRSKPVSKYVPHYNKGMIECFLKTAGFGYNYFADEEVGNRLGGFPKDPECYDNDIVSYESVRTRKWFQEALTELMEYAKERRVALLCAEENPYRCHRHNLLTQSLLTKGATVLHIRGDGSLDKAVKETRQSNLSTF
jgi:uncharacterized protein (DUF488 family)